MLVRKHNAKDGPLEVTVRTESGEEVTFKIMHIMQGGMATVAVKAPKSMTIDINKPATITESIEEAVKRVL